MSTLLYWNSTTCISQCHIYFITLTNSEVSILRVSAIFYHSQCLWRLYAWMKVNRFFFGKLCTSHKTHFCRDQKFNSCQSTGVEVIKTHDLISGHSLWLNGCGLCIASWCHGVKLFTSKNESIVLNLLQSTESETTQSVWLMRCKHSAETNSSSLWASRTETPVQMTNHHPMTHSHIILQLWPYDDLQHFSSPGLPEIASYITADLWMLPNQMDFICAEVLWISFQSTRVVLCTNYFNTWINSSLNMLMVSKWHKLGQKTVIKLCCYDPEMGSYKVISLPIMFLRLIIKR